MADTFCVLVCGGRDYTDRDTVFSLLDYLHAKRAITVIIHGAARGADTLAGEWAQERGIPEERYPADWALYGKRAGPVRNEQMLREGNPHMVVAFPGGSGTSHMVSIAKREGILTWDLRKLS
jgi:hypothetical protein